jgi:hypothetical protein
MKVGDKVKISPPGWKHSGKIGTIKYIDDDYYRVDTGDDIVPYLKEELELVEEKSEMNWVKFSERKPTKKGSYLTSFIDETDCRYSYWNGQVFTFLEAPDLWLDGVPNLPKKSELGEVSNDGETISKNLGYIQVRSPHNQVSISYSFTKEEVPYLIKHLQTYLDIGKLA